MKIYAPIYYKDFKCIADRCRHSCCVGWEIDIDEASLSRYEKMNGREKILETVESTCGTPHFRLTDGERCPHLSANGLCNIITEHGEEYLCDICREHPRFYNVTSRGLEVGVGASCEAAAELILNSAGYSKFIEIGDTEDEILPKEFNTVSEREKIYAILSSTSLPYYDRLKMLWESYAVSPEILTDSKWHEVISSLEYLNDASREKFLLYSSTLATKSEHHAPLERFLAYLIYRHTGNAETAAEFRMSLRFAFFAERLLASLLNAGGDVTELVRIISEELEYSEENTEAIKFEFI